VCKPHNEVWVRVRVKVRVTIGENKLKVGILGTGSG